MIWLLLLPAGLLLLLLVFLAGAIGQRHHMEKDMSLLQDAEAVIERIEAKVEAAVAPLHDRLLKLEADLEQALGEKDSLLARLEQLGEKIIGLVTPGETAAPQPEQPTS